MSMEAFTYGTCESVVNGVHRLSRSHNPVLEVMPHQVALQICYRRFQRLGAGNGLTRIAVALGHRLHR